MNHKEQFKTLLRRYSEIKDELLEFTEEYHDAMLFDIEGYRETNDILDMHDLNNQVEAFELMLLAFKKINYIYS